MGLAKPLKGNSLVLDSANIGKLRLDQLDIPLESLQYLMTGLNLNNVLMTNSQIENTIIGKNVSNEGNFTELITSSDVIMYNLDKLDFVSWDATNSIFSIGGSFSVIGCATIGNIQICHNTISAINNNGNINIVPNNLGTIYLTGPIQNVVNSQGNYLTNLANGNINFLSSDYILFNSSYGFYQLDTFSDQMLTTTNGDISLTTEYNLTPKPINTIQNSGGTAVSTIEYSNIRIGDEITISGTNSNPNMDGIYIVTNVINKNTFLISTGNTFTGLLSNSTTGSILKTPSNNINLNAAVHVKIPSNIDLIFGDTTNNIYGNTGGLFITSLQNVNFNVPGKIEIPQNVNFQLGTSSNTNMNFDGSNLNINSTGGTIALTSSTGLFNIPSLFITDQNPLIANYTQSSSDMTDKGLQFKYWDSTNGSSLGWFGYKQSTGKFTFLTRATNSNDIITGISSALDIGSINVTNVILNTGGTFNANCGQLTNLSLISGCSGTVNINGSSNVNISSGTRLALISGGDIFIPNNIQITLGTSGSFIKEGTFGNLKLTGAKNILLNTQTNGSIVIPINTVLSFDGTSVGNQNIHSNSNGNLILNSNKNIFLTTTGGNIILPSSTFNTSSSIQFGDTSNTIYGGTTNGIYINSLNNSINFIASSNVNISSSSGNLLLQALNGDINLLSSQGNVCLYQGSRLVFGINNTSNSIRSNTIGSLIINGPGSSVGNMIILQNTSEISLSANTCVNIPSNTILNLATDNSKFIVTDTNGNFNITNNNNSNGNINIISYNTSIFNTGGITTIINNTTNISSSNFTLTGSIGNLNSGDLYLAAQNPVLANYIQTNTDLTDRGVLYNYYSTNVSSAALGWFGVKKDTQQFTFYQTAINNNDIITGTLGSIALGNLNVNSNITFLSTGNLNMACGTINNLNTILGCNGMVNINGNSNVNVSATNIMLASNSSGTIGLPFNTPLSFGNTSNSIIVTSNGNMTINSNGGTGTLILNSNVQINGITDNVYSTVTNYQDPIISIGGVTSPTTNDLKDRGIEFKWNSGSITQTGFFGFQNSTQRFVFYSQDTNTNEIISGSFGNVQFANGYYNNLDVSCGTIANVSLLTACNSIGLTISSSSGINLSTNNILVSDGGKLNFGNTNNTIYSTNGTLNITSQFNTNITSQSGGITFNTNTNGSGFTQFSTNSPMYFGETSGNNFLMTNTQGDFIIENSTGNIYLNPLTNTANSSGGYVVIPTNDTLIWGNTKSNTNITSDGTTLYLNGYNISINSTGPITLQGDVNILGSLAALTASVNNDYYILPLGTEEILQASSIVNGISRYINITTTTPHYLTVGDLITIKNSDSTPSIDGSYIVYSILNQTVFSVAYSSSLSSPGTVATIKGVLVTYQGKDVGLEFDFWSNTTGNGITSGSQYYVTGGLVRQSTTGNLAFYSNATISNSVVTNGILGNMQLNELFTNKISGFTLDGPIVGGTFIIGGSNFQISGGNIDNTPIGQTIAQSGNFTNLSSTISTNLQNTTLQGTFNYSIERYTLSSLLPTRNPSISTVISYVSINGVTFIGKGTMGNLNVNDGDVKKISISSMGNNCQYQLAFPSGTLITPNPLNGPLPTMMTFKRAGQSCEIMWDATLSSWILQNGNVYIS